MTSLEGFTTPSGLACHPSSEGNVPHSLASVVELQVTKPPEQSLFLRSNQPRTSAVISARNRCLVLGREGEALVEPKVTNDT
jgi:hypothetical protein